MYLKLYLFIVAVIQVYYVYCWPATSNARSKIVISKSAANDSKIKHKVIIKKAATKNSAKLTLKLKSTTTAKTTSSTSTTTESSSSIEYTGRKPKPYNETKYSQKYDNPAFVRDRFKKEIVKPQMSETWKNKNRKPFNSAWMDYCDPYHCNDYHKTACGLNRKNMKFKWFQSACHVAMNNLCATYRGNLKYDLIDTKHCVAYVMFLRAGCTDCEDDSRSPICAMSISDHSVVLFRNQCAMQKANCNLETLDDYIQVEMNVCTLMQVYEHQDDYLNPKSPFNSFSLK